ncbi:MAG: bifunctional diaminohydroxyphosphoribosylaminopyrimidine deaminase/5-amino-6-(5-phosphoribosylamino)uracil reductase RibD [Planctomycetaceae bacterium]|nr:bifunctional diaminohydroxyphosphoribosylaminopyrimidine deaminase/5-amino-6-(5-phosphoribosylamino)uracil reductase RibD [Planctomycetaceae bacterium]
MNDNSRPMQRAIELARRGEGLVEPNPMVGCVLVRNGNVVGEGWHQRFGGAHAEIEALATAGAAAHGATAFVTLEPCAHQGQTPPCTEALIAAHVARVVVGCRDPNPVVDGRGIGALRAAGITVELFESDGEAAALIAPFTKLMNRGRPWVIAKWAMTLDGKLAAASGDSRWISGEESRAVVHRLRGRMDAIVVGRGTAEHDDPLLTARPVGARTPTRIVLDSQAVLSLDSQLVRTSSEAPVLVAAAANAPESRCHALREAGVEVWQAAPTALSASDRWLSLLDELGRRRMTNVLVEGGAKVLGALLDAHEIDEVHAFIAPRIVGGAGPSPLAGEGLPTMAQALSLVDRRVESLGEDLYVHGRLKSEKAR